MLYSLLVVATLLAPALTVVQHPKATILGQYGHSPAVYPSPNATGSGGWEDALAKATDFVAQLTLEEKAWMVTGRPGPCVGNIRAIPRLGFPGLCLQDGPLAIRTVDFASVFPAGVTTAASFDRKLMYERGVAMGAEFRGKGATVALSPVAGPLGRSAYGGRNWEGFSPDPYLTGVAMEQTISGLQSNGLQACAKHWIGNEQETQRNPTFARDANNRDSLLITQEALSTNIDDRTMHELYMWPFANAVKAGVASVMCSYQRINGSYGCQNSKSLNGYLKEELGFQGYVMSDWGATHSGVPSIEAGLDMNMPGGLGLYGSRFFTGLSDFGGNVTLAVNNGTLQSTRVDDMVIRIMTPYFWLGQDKDYPSVDPSSAYLNTFHVRGSWLDQYVLNGTSSRDVRADHGDLIRKHGASSTVLLKNLNNTLPLQKPKSIAVFGNDASEVTQGFLNQDDYEYGNLVAGGGSGTGRLTYLVTPLEAIKARAKADGTFLQYWLNNTLIATKNIATDLAVHEEPEACLVFLKTWAEESLDRSSLELDWHGNEVVASVAAFCRNTIVVTHSSGINDLPFADHPNVTAILAAHYAGQEAGNSIVDVLYGAVNPSGKLPYTIALRNDDYNGKLTTAVNDTGVDAWQVWFEEKLEIDYRHFDARNLSVRYEFGFGLSYTSFALADLAVSRLVESISPLTPTAPTVPGGNPALWEHLYTVTVTLTNTGSVAGAEVPQLYLSLPESAPAGTPPRQLRGFEKVFLAPGASETVSFGLMRRDLSYWDIVSQDWVIPDGEFGVSVGFSSRDLKVSGGFSVV